MSENIIEGERRELYSSFKRFFSFIIDAFLVLGISFFLILFVSNYSISHFAKEEILQINEIYREECEKKDYPYSVGPTYGIYQLDFDNFVDNKIQEGKAETEAIEDYFVAYEEIDKLVTGHEGFQKLYNSINSLYLLHVFLSFFLASMIFELIIPLFTRYHQTIGMMITKSCLVDKENVIISNKKIFIRYLFLFILELLVAFLIFSYFGLIFVGLFSLVCISFTQNRMSFHDAIIKAKIIEKEKAYLE